MNEDTGGYVCVRSITWAKDSPPPGAASARVSVCAAILPDQSLFFDGTTFLGSGSPVYFPGCVTRDTQLEGSSFVLANSLEEAVALCRLNLTENATAFNWRESQQRDFGDPRVYGCSPGDG